ncbi:zinc-binding dehydrogenase [Cerasicoccus fimbriatus]|uniref:zinc-binding dehydrogenase n=1 Tax=Cerasicoccus fimbriatus TaxID=3014554 RepID=UPI0022B3554A|nr:zinc-binding dehydrogenase [Cerasicoccus sp. TK19100]
MVNHSGMRAWITHPDKPYIKFAEIEEPSQRPDEALIEVKAVSINRGELVSLPNFWDVRMDGSTMSMPMGSVPGYELSGIVVRPAADGTGPKVGARVAGFPARGTWAEFAAVRTCLLGEIDPSVSFEEAATLPVAGQTAYRALRRGGLLLGQRVLITGAAGGVGTYAIQLAKLAGANVTGVARSEERRQALLELGADAVIETLSPDGPRQYDLIMESVGGDSLGAAFARIDGRGVIVQYGEASLAPITFPAGLYATMPAVRYEPFLLYPDLLSDYSGTRTLELLSGLIAEGRLRPVISDIMSWSDTPKALEKLQARSVIGKIVLQID